MSGVMFSLQGALSVNTLGLLILSIVPYWIGQHLGASALDQLRERNPKLRKMERFEIHNEMLQNILIRLLGIPVNLASLYMGARHFSFGKYLFAPVLGNLPKMVPYTLMGLNADNPKSSVIIAALIWEFLLAIGTAVVFFINGRSTAPSSLEER